MALTGNEGQPIDLETAAQWTRNYREAKATILTEENRVLSYLYREEAVRQLLEQEGCAGIRMYNGLDGQNQRQLILVGVAVDGTDMTEGVIIAEAAPCPPICTVSPLAQG